MRESREPNQSAMEMARSYWLAKHSSQRWVLEAPETTFERIWWSFLPHDLWRKSKPASSWKHVIMLVCFLLCSVAFVIRKKEWHFSSWCAPWMAALCRTALTFSIFCHLNASCLFRASIAPGKCEAMGKCRLLKRQSCDSLSYTTKCEGYRSDAALWVIAVRMGWGWTALCSWAFRGLLCRTVWLDKISRKMAFLCVGETLLTFSRKGKTLILRCCELLAGWTMFCTSPVCCLSGLFVL